MGFGVVVFDKIDRAFDRNDAVCGQFGAQAGKAANAPAVGRDRIAKRPCDHAPRIVRNGFLDHQPPAGNASHIDRKNQGQLRSPDKSCRSADNQRSSALHRRSPGTAYWGCHTAFKRSIAARNAILEASRDGKAGCATVCRVRQACSETFWMVMALTGQTASQRPQRTHWLWSIQSRL